MRGQRENRLAPFHQGSSKVWSQWLSPGEKSRVPATARTLAIGVPLENILKTRALERAHPQYWKLLVPVLMAAAIAVVWFFSPVDDWIRSFSGWIQGLGAWGYVLFSGIFAAATIVAAPTSLFTVAAGFLFGIGWGLLVVQAGAMIGGALAFLIARYLLRDTVKAFIKRRPRFLALDHAVAKEGWKIALLMHLNPLVPFNFQNYAFGLTRIKFWPYVGTCLGIIPGVLLYLYLGAAGGALTGDGKWGAAQWSFFALGLVATLAATVFISKKAKEQLDNAGIEEGGRGQPASAGHVAGFKATSSP